MDTDLYLVIGIVICVVAIPALLSAFVEGRPPRGGAILVLIGGVLIIVALTNRSQNYTFAEIPRVFGRVIDRYIP